MSNPHQKFFKLVKCEAPDNKHEIAIKSLPRNVKVEIPSTTNNVHVKQEPLDKKPLKLEIPLTLTLEATKPEDLPPADVKDVLTVPPSIISEYYSPRILFLILSLLMITGF
ncbi:hypothetical protein L1987_48721 [Smallanthus sonchifolius]|uniref:Uncharacterized protein n=1 Tax=Smallanthus sonchifolius TaxID=185202 RepID=A0ACB9FUD6_9ASTR|nr:hypothetical protein L1987_48721 [Smallanthus sonchifolius]